MPTIEPEILTDGNIRVYLWSEEPIYFSIGNRDYWPTNIEAVEKEIRGLKLVVSRLRQQGDSNDAKNSGHS